MPSNRREYTQVVNHRFNPFTEADESTVITDEGHFIVSASPYQIQLKEVPKEDSPSLVTIAGFTEVSGTPTAGEFRVDYTFRTGLIQFDSSAGGSSVQVSYTGLGTPVSADITNDILDHTDNASGAWNGVDWDEHFVNPYIGTGVYTPQTAGFGRSWKFAGARSPLWITNTLWTNNIILTEHAIRMNIFGAPSGGNKVLNFVANERNRLQWNPSMYEWRFRWEGGSTATSHFWFGLIDASNATGPWSLAAAIMMGDGPGAGRTIATTAGRISWGSIDIAVAGQTDIFLPYDISTWNSIRLYVRPELVTWSYLNTIGAWEDKFNITTANTHVPSSIDLTFMYGVGAAAVANANDLYIDYVRRVSLGNSLSPT